MIKDALEYLLSLKRPETVEVAGRSFSTNRLTPIEEPVVAALAVDTLTGLLDYLAANKDALDLETLTLHVVDPLTVRIIGPVFGPFRQREVLLVAKCEPAPFPFGRSIDLENFIIGLQANFVPCQTSQSILELISCITSEVGLTVADDGVTQEATVKKGMALKERRTIPNPVILSPFRTFREVEQVSSAFVFRVKDGPACALHEADGGAWKLEAMMRVKDYLKKHRPDITVIA